MLSSVDVIQSSSGSLVGLTLCELNLSNISTRALIALSDPSIANDSNSFWIDMNRGSA